MHSHDGGARGHHPAIGLNALAVERRSDNAPLPLVHLAIARDETFTQENFHAALRALFDEVLRLVDQDFADELRFGGENNMCAPKPVVRGRTVSFGEVLKQRDGVPRLEKAIWKIERQVQLETRREPVAAALNKDWFC